VLAAWAGGAHSQVLFPGYRRRSAQTRPKRGQKGVHIRGSEQIERNAPGVVVRADYLPQTPTAADPNPTQQLERQSGDSVILCQQSQQSHRLRTEAFTLPLISLHNKTPCSLKRRLSAGGLDAIGAFGWK